MHGHQHGTTIRIHAIIGMGVTNITDHPPGNRLVIQYSLGRQLPTNQYQSGGRKHLGRYPTVRINRKGRI